MGQMVGEGVFMLFADNEWLLAYLRLMDECDLASKAVAGTTNSRVWR